MNINKPTVELWKQEPGIDGLYRHIERCGRVCYKSKSKGDAYGFVKRLMESGHTSVLEHGSVYLKIPHDSVNIQYTSILAMNPYTENIFNYDDNHVYISTNLRVLFENNLLNLLHAFWCEPTGAHDRRYSFHFTTQIAVSRELNRHRANSVSEQSTRYCNYSKEKFGSVLTINSPIWTEAPEEAVHSYTKEQVFDIIKKGELERMNANDWFRFSNVISELSYMQILANGRKPEEARCILPLDTQTEVVQTAFGYQWRKFYELRYLGSSGKPHPDAKRIAEYIGQVLNFPK